jgi:hypothetical protein
MSDKPVLAMALGPQRERGSCGAVLDRQGTRRFVWQGRERACGARYFVIIGNGALELFGGLRLPLFLASLISLRPYIAATSRSFVVRISMRESNRDTIARPTIGESSIRSDNGTTTEPVCDPT